MTKTIFIENSGCELEITFYGCFFFEGYCVQSASYNVSIQISIGHIIVLKKCIKNVCIYILHSF